MSDHLRTLADVMKPATSRGRGGAAFAPPRPLGFVPLDDLLGGGVRAGELVLLGGPQGLGKTTMALQMARHVLDQGGTALYASFEHDEAVLLLRLLAIETAHEAGLDGPGLDALRLALVDDGRPLQDRLGGLEGATEAYQRVQSYAPRLHIFRQPTGRTTVTDLRDAVTAVTGSPLVVVDYLQKLHAPGETDQDAAAGAVAEGLKDLAMQSGVPLLAIVAADRAGLAGRRLRIHHLRGSSALAYEADAVLMLNDKYEMVARHHLVYDVSNAERFRDYVVLTVEKNRSGRDRVDLEFAKQFALGRFDPDGQEVGEQLIDDRVYVE